MQIIHKHENEGDSSRRANSVGIIICARRIGRYLKGKHFREFKSRKFGI